jgi:hypothetical protein
VEALKIVKDVEGIGFVYFDDKDVVRHKLVQQIVKAYESYSESAHHETPAVGARRPRCHRRRRLGSLRAPACALAASVRPSRARGDVDDRHRLRCPVRALNRRYRRKDARPTSCRFPRTSRVRSATS